MNTSKHSSVALALAAAGLFVTAPAARAEAEGGAATADPVHCYGVNACKGQNDVLVYLLLDSWPPTSSIRGQKSEAWDSPHAPHRPCDRALL